MASQFRLPDEFADHVVRAIRFHLRASQDAYVPSALHLAEALEIAFWASLIPDEARQASFTICLRPRDSASRVIALREPLTLSAEQLAKFAMATTSDVSAVHVGPDPADQGLQILGIDTLLQTAAPVRIDVRGPATLAIKSADATIAIVAGPRAELVNLTLYAHYWFVDGEFPRQFGDNSQRDYRLNDVVKAMCAHAHGGTILIVPKTKGLVEDSHIDILYRVDPHFDGLRQADMKINEAAKFRALSPQAVEVRRAASDLRNASGLRERYVAAIGRATAVDGALVLSTDGELIGFGAKIRGSTGELRVRRFGVTEDPEPTIVDIRNFGGTRHQSAARFVAQHPNSRAVVASQDGKLSILQFTAEDDIVDCLEHAEWLF